MTNLFIIVNKFKGRFDNISAEDQLELMNALAEIKKEQDVCKHVLKEIVMFNRILRVCDWCGYECD